MDNDDPQTVKRMLFYLYTLDYPDHDVPNIQAEHVATGRYAPPHLQHKTPTTIEEKSIMSANLGNSEGATTTHDPRMMNNVRVYAVAEKYDIPDLKDLAKGKFQGLARSKWPHDDFHALAEEVFSTTPDTDMGLRQVVLDLCEEHFQDILRNGDSRVLLEIPAIEAVVLDAAVCRIDQDKTLLDGAQAKLVEVSQAEAKASRRTSEELSLVKAELEKAHEQKVAWASQLDLLFEYAYESKRCRRCHGDIKCSLEGCASPGSRRLQLRCATCRNSHTLLV